MWPCSASPSPAQREGIRRNGVGSDVSHTTGCLQSAFTGCWCGFTRWKICVPIKGRGGSQTESFEGENEQLMLQAASRNHSPCLPAPRIGLEPTTSLMPFESASLACVQGSARPHSPGFPQISEGGELAGIVTPFCWVPTRLGLM